jgi:heme A synthase
VDSPERRRARSVAWGALAINVGVILWGAVVRATGSGAGCGNHWPLCNGDVVPQDPSIATLIEFSHRLTSGVALIATVVLVYSAWRAYPPGHRVRLGAVLAGATIIVESLLGAGLVLLDMVAQNRSLARGWWVGGHLVNTLALLSAFTAAAVWASGTPRPQFPDDARRRRLFAVVMLAMGIMAITGATGAITALGDTLFPASSLAEGLAQKAMADAHPFVRMRNWHPAVAVIAAMALGLAGRAIADASASTRGRRLADGVALACLVQLGVGALNVFLLAPVWMQLLHLAMADAIWIGATWMILECLANDTLPGTLHAEPST